MNRIRTAIALILVTINSAGVAGPIFKLHTQIALVGSEICGKKLGIVYGRELDEIAQNELCLTGDFIRSRTTENTIRSSEVKAALRQKMPELEVVGPEILYVREAGDKPIEPIINKAQEWLRRELEAEYQSIEIGDYTGNKEIHLDGDLAWSLRKDKVKAKHYQCLWLDGSKKHKVVQSVPICFKVSAYKKVVAYSDDVTFGDVITADKLIWKLLEVTSLSGEPIDEIPENSQISNVTKSAGEAVLKGDIKNRPHVLKGSEVTVRSKVGIVEIIARADAEEDGYLGDKVRVRVRNGERAFEALVSGTDLVEINGTKDEK